ncbi:MAG: hypothetical protein AB1578_15230 [Thermodesulfobacteriota bacterium]
MTQPGTELAFLVLLAGLLIVASQGLRAGLERARVPPLVGFLSMGVLARVAARA